MRWFFLAVSAVSLSSCTLLCVLVGQLLLGQPEFSAAWFAWSTLTVVAIGSTQSWIIRLLMRDLGFA